MAGYSPAGLSFSGCPNCAAMDEALDVAAREVMQLRQKIKFLEATLNNRMSGPALCQADGYAEEEFGARTSD